ncbi:MAG: HypC/HybG/HupF family hydrogenase formation chaperone, partial [Rubripirellula sp.]
MCLAVPGRVRVLYEDGETRMGKLDFGGVVKDVCLEFLPDLQVGEYALVHVGFALSRIDEASAAAALKTFAEIDAIEQKDAIDRDTERDTERDV